MSRCERYLRWACLALATAGLLAGCPSGKKPAAPAKKPANTVPLDKVWTTDEIAQNPEGYMTWAGAKMESQVNDRKSRLKAVEDRLDAIQKRQEALKTRLGEARNVQMRMEQAVQRAEDEDRWPASMGGRTFTRDEAQAVTRQAQQYIDDNRSMGEAYDKAVARAQAAVESLRKDVATLSQYRERLELDLGNIRLSEGMTQIDQLRKKEQEISSFAKSLGTMADESLTEKLPDEKQPQSVLKGLLK